MEKKKPFSKLKTQIENLFEPKLQMEFCCNSYPVRSQWGHNSIPRFYVKLGDQIIWDFPKKFSIRVIDFGFWADNNGISQLVREYIDTPVELLLDKKFEGEKRSFNGIEVDYGLTDLFKAADRRLGREGIFIWADKPNSQIVDKILVKRFMPRVSFWELATLNKRGLARQKGASIEQMRLSVLQIRAFKNEVDESLLTDDFAAKLLAYSLELADYKRVWDYKPMLEGVLIAVQKRHFVVGKEPNFKFLAMFREYKWQLQEQGESCSWLAEIAEHYGVKLDDFKRVKKTNE